MLTIFWDVNGPLLVHFKEKIQTVTSPRYSNMLGNELKRTIQSKRWGLLSKRVLLLHDNTRPHTADTLHALKFEVLKHPPHSSDLVPSDFHLFGPMKEHLWGQKFADDEVMEAVQSWLKARPKSFFLEGIRKPEDRWTKCVEKQGEYVKNKTQTISISTLVKSYYKTPVT